MTNLVLQSIAEALQTVRPEGARKKEVVAGPGRLQARDLGTAEKLSLFVSRAQSSGAVVHRCRDLDSLAATIEKLLREGSNLAVASRKRIEGNLGISIENLLPSSCRWVDGEHVDKERLFHLDAALTDVEAGIAETGSIMLRAGDGKPRSISLVAEQHLALIRPDQIVPDLLDWAELKEGCAGGFTLITGPSKTADIELNLVVGVHGPARLHLLLFEQE